MLYRKMTRSDDHLSILGFGCMRFPQTNGKIDRPRAMAMLRQAIDGGLNYLDTAFPYHGGESEDFLGEALCDGYREKVQIATKLPHWLTKTREDMDGILATQLEKLKTDHIDYYLIHALDGGSWTKLQSLDICDFLDKALADGRIRHAGFSFHGDIDAFKEIVDAYDWTFCQIQYNILDEQSQAGIEGMKYAAAKGLGVIVMEPLRGGNLAGKIPPKIQEIWDESPVKRSPVEWSLRWIWNHPEVTLILSGMSDEAQIEENMNIADKAKADSLTDGELALVDRAKERYRELMKIGCTSCRYCMPCPAGVNIPGCFELYNSYHMFDDKRTPKFFYLGWMGGLMSGKPSKASLCTGCGKCEAACPQHLPIQKHLRDTAKEFEGLRFKIISFLAKPYMLYVRWKTLRKTK
jgi:uncharacterized protein